MVAVESATAEGVRRPVADDVTELEARVRSNLGGQVRRFRIRRDPSGLVLHGWVNTYYAKQLAQHAVMAATGLPILSNQIEVRSDH